MFDFGLCKDLDPRLKSKDGSYGYRLTGRAGSLPYSKCLILLLWCHKILLLATLGTNTSFPLFLVSSLLCCIVVSRLCIRCYHL